MYRIVLEEILAWKDSLRRKPLILKGARTEDRKNMTTLS